MVSVIFEVLGVSGIAHASHGAFIETHSHAPLRSCRTEASWRHLGGVLEAFLSWRRLGGVLEASWRRPGLPKTNGK